MAIADGIERCRLGPSGISASAGAKRSLSAAARVQRHHR